MSTMLNTLKITAALADSEHHLSQLDAALEHQKQLRSFLCLLTVIHTPQ